jgi:hypothetical protein
MCGRLPRAIVSSRIADIVMKHGADVFGVYRMPLCSYFDGDGNGPGDEDK